uniref:SCP domain-containing protein n=1 Tax=Syphacia muris TaxID=451379 RepID=A0A0N5AHQ3_9BILA
MEKRTIVEKSIIHSTPSGRILSETKMKTIYYDGKRSRRSNKRLPSLNDSWDTFSDSVSVKYNCKKNSRPMATTSKLATSQQSPLQHRHFTSAETSPRHQHHTIDDNLSSTTEYINIHYLDDSTVYGDKWSSENTGVQESKLAYSDNGWTSNNAMIVHNDVKCLKHFINRINCKRENHLADTQLHAMSFEVNKHQAVLLAIFPNIIRISTLLPPIRIKHYQKPPLKQDSALNESAQYWASVLVINNEFKYRPDTTMNLWMGSKPNAAVVDIWDEEMQDWPSHHFKNEQLTKVGLARAYDDAKHAFVIVAEYM